MQLPVRLGLFFYKGITFWEGLNTGCRIHTHKHAHTCVLPNVHWHVRKFFYFKISGDLVILILLVIVMPFQDRIDGGSYWKLPFGAISACMYYRLLRAHTVCPIKCVMRPAPWWKPVHGLPPSGSQVESKPHSGKLTSWLGIHRAQSSIDTKTLHVINVSVVSMGSSV